MAKRKIKRIAIVILLLVALVVFLVCAFYRGLVVRHYTLSTQKLPADARIRLAVVTDLHSCVYGDNQSEILALVAKQNPDLILLGGDIVDDVNPLEGAVSFFEGLQKLGIPSYYVSGNHDHWRPDYSEVKQMIADYGTTLLESEILTVDVRGQSIQLCGIMEYSSAVKCSNALGKIAAPLSDTSFNILLAHRPDYIDLYREYPFDLVLCGHTHGGQVRIPLLVNGLFAPNQGWFPAYAGGLYDLENTTLIVSRGLSYYPKLPRIFNPPELVVVDIEGIA